MLKSESLAAPSVISSHEIVGAVAPRASLRRRVDHGAPGREEAGMAIGARGDMAQAGATAVLLGDLALVESPRWRDGRLWFCDWAAGEIVAVDLAGRRETILAMSS